MTLFYVFPLAISVWFVDLRMGYVIAVLSASAGVLVDVFANPHHLRWPSERWSSDGAHDARRLPQAGPDSAVDEDATLAGANPVLITGWAVGGPNQFVLAYPAHVLSNRAGRLIGVTDTSWY